MIKLIGSSHQGKLTVLVPKEYDEKEIEIMIVSSRDRENVISKKIERNNKVEKLVSILDPVTAS
ncbi:MAG: hypothetical protein ABIR03_06390 [Ginsengibacter sp.]